MNFPLVPLSISPKVLAVLFVSVSFIKIGIDKGFDSIGGIFTEKTSSTGEADVDTVLHFLNPPSQHCCRIRFSHHRCTEQSLLECTLLILSGGAFFGGEYYGGGA
jgi:hypothetical protein